MRTNSGKCRFGTEQGPAPPSVSSPLPGIWTILTVAPFTGPILIGDEVYNSGQNWFGKMCSVKDVNKLELARDFGLDCGAIYNYLVASSHIRALRNLCEPFPNWQTLVPKPRNPNPLSWSSIFFCIAQKGQWVYPLQALVVLDYYSLVLRALVMGL